MDEFVTAAKENNTKSLSLLLQRSDVFLDETNWLGKTAVTFAIENNSVDAVRWLVEHGCRLARAPTADQLSMQTSADQNPIPLIITDDFYPPLLAAATAHSTELVTLLLESGRVQVDEGCKDVTPLVQACSDGLADVVTLLLSYGANVNGCKVGNNLALVFENPKEWNHCPLYHAIKHGHGDVVDILIKYGAMYVSQVEKCRGTRPCSTQESHVCYCSCMPEFFIGKSGSDFQKCWGSLLELAVLKCSSRVEHLLDIYHNEISRGDVYRALVLSIQIKSVPFTQLFLNKFYIHKHDKHEIPAQNIQLCGNSYYHILRLAVGKSCREEETILLLLLQFGTLLTTDTSGDKIMALLILSIMNILPHTVARLVEISTSHFDRNLLEQSPITVGSCFREAAQKVALSRGNLQILQVLHDAGWLHLNSSETMFAVLSCDKSDANIYDTLKWLMEQGLNLRVTDDSSREPIHEAVKMLKPEAIDALCRLGVDANAQTSNWDALSPLNMHFNLCILQLGVDPHVIMIKTLISHGADLAMLNRCGYTPISMLFWLIEKSRWSRHGEIPLSRNYEQVPICDMPLTFNRCAFFPVSGPECDSAEGSQVDREHSTDADPNLDASPRSVKTPIYLHHSQTQRNLIEILAKNFGLELLSMGAAVLIGQENWYHMDRSFTEAGISIQHAPKLQALCWRRVRACLGSVWFQQKLDQLPLPKKLKAYLRDLDIPE